MDSCVYKKNLVAQAWWIWVFSKHKFLVKPCWTLSFFKTQVPGAYLGNSTIAWTMCKFCYKWISALEIFGHNPLAPGSFTKCSQSQSSPSLQQELVFWKYSEFAKLAPAVHNIPCMMLRPALWPIQYAMYTFHSMDLKRDLSSGHCTIKLELWRWR